MDKDAGRLRTAAVVLRRVGLAMPVAEVSVWNRALRLIGFTDFVP